MKTRITRALTSAKQRGVLVAVALGGTAMMVAMTACAAVPGQAAMAGSAPPATPASTIASAPAVVTQTMTETVQVTSTATAAPAQATAAASTPAAPAAPSTTARETAANDDELYKETASAVAVTEGFWNDTFIGWDVIWHGPSTWAGNGFYDSNKRDLAGAEWWTEGPSCGERAPDWNAFFCANGQVAWDRPLMEAGYTGIGKAFVYVVVAHEWGHAAQQRFIADGEGPAVLIQEELQADCLAGTTIAGAVNLGYLDSEVADPEELSATLEAMGDQGTWHGAGDHGSSEERVSWFRTGFDGGIEACLGNA